MKKRLSIPLLAGLGLLLWALLSPPRQLVQEPLTVVSEKRAPENYAIGVEVREFGESGKLLSRTRAQTLRRFPAEAVTELAEPEREGYSGDFAWTASAREGRLLEATEVLELRREVTLRYATEDVEFASEAMNVNLKADTARSLAPVRSWQGDHEVSGDSLLVEMGRQVALLSGSVRSVYVPKS